MPGQALEDPVRQRLVCQNCRRRALMVLPHCPRDQRRLRVADDDARRVTCRRLCSSARA